ncbi:SDR family NAD(P)-dependent oxidoreductase [Halomonas cibimaris]|uniref:SDR family NAD(P)-dependent oxidoreductase n=1 Tax=Halomonas cibimaris TaxID=657012 RepID=A0ABP7LJZ6_9GAMM
MFSHLPDAYTAVVTGTSGGIGNAIAKALLASPQLGRLIAVSRSTTPSLDHHDARVTTLALDVTQQNDRKALREHLDGQPVHLLFNAIGTLHDESLDIHPEKRLEQLSADALAHLMHVNASTPILLLAALKPSLKGKHPAIFASLSARVGSISDNGFGGWYSYRASKAAHNMLMKTASIELARLNKASIVLCLHPGTTNTPLSEPFQTRVPPGKLFSPAFVAQCLIDVMAARTPEDTGSFWDWDGKPIEW